MVAKKKKAMAWHKGGCHCGAVSFEVRAPNEVELVDCNCSMCAKTGYLHLIVPKKDFKLTRGEKVILLGSHLRLIPAGGGHGRAAAPRPVGHLALSDAR